MSIIKRSHNAGGRKARPNAVSLDELFPVDASTREIGGLVMIKRGAIVVKKQIRRDAAADIDGFRENISEMKKAGLGIDGSGILSPLLVTPDPDQDGFYLLIAGERRFVASEGIADELPCFVQPSSEAAVQMTQGIENLQRKSFTLQEEMTFVAMLRSQNISLRNIGAITGQGKGWTENRDRLNRAEPDVLRALSVYTDSKGITLTNLILIDNVKRDRELRAALLSRAIGGATEAEIRNIILTAENRARREEESAALPAPSPRDYGDGDGAKPDTSLAPSEAGRFWGQSSAGTGSLALEGGGGISVSHTPAPQPDVVRHFLEPAGSYLSEATRMLDEGAAPSRAAAERALDTIDLQVKGLRRRLDRQGGGAT